MLREEGESHDEAEAVRVLVTARLLCLDDVAARGLSEWGKEMVLSIVGARWDAERPLLATTNVEPRELARYMGSRTASRLRDLLWVRVGGADMRGPKG